MFDCRPFMYSNICEDFTRCASIIEYLNEDTLMECSICSSYAPWIQVQDSPT